MIAATVAAALKAAALLLTVALVAVAVADLATMSLDCRIRMLSRSGLSQRAIADRVSVSRHRVRVALAP
mgnify:CR=1 FL=1